MYLAFSLVVLATACGSTSDGGPDGSNAGAGGTSAGAAGTTNPAGGAAAGGTTFAGAASGGTSTAGHSATGGQNAAAGHAGTGGNATVGGEGGRGGNTTAGAANDNGGAPSTAGLPFAGSCLDAVHCTDEWDTTFGAATLQQLCTAQQGTWSSGHCAEAPWKKKCTQSVFGGVYVQYLPADGICAAGFEEAL